jgi:cysteine desulfurase
MPTGPLSWFDMSDPIYMDNHATTPVDPRVLEAMLPYFCEKFGNAASRSHRFGWEADEAVERARAQVAALIGARPKDIVFTSGATEADNLAIKGVLEFHVERGDHIVTAASEHKAVLDSCRALERAGKASVTVLPVDARGRIDPADVARAITDRTVLVSIMHANNEIGTIQPLAEIGAITRERGVLFHTDATQAVGRIPVDVESMNINLLSMSAHKLHGPKGVGALYVRSRNPRVRLAPQMHGGGHERGLRSGTLDVPGIVGLGAACALAAAEMATEQPRILALRQKLHRGLAAEIDGIGLNGDFERRLPGNLNLCFEFVEAESLLMALPDIALSSGSACTSATLEPSHVLRAIGLDDEQAHSSVRFGLGRFNTEDEVDHVVGRVAEEVRRQRALSPRHEVAERAAAAARA